MKIGVINETKDQENRLSLPPTGAHSLVQAGHRVMMQKGAGSRLTDAAFHEAWAFIVSVNHA